MTDRTPTWKQRADRVGLPYRTLALATGKSESAVEKYARGARNPSPDWLARVERMLDEIEQAVEGGNAA